MPVKLQCLSKVWASTSMINVYVCHIILARWMFYHLSKWTSHQVELHIELITYLWKILLFVSTVWFNPCNVVSSVYAINLSFSFPSDIMYYNAVTRPITFPLSSLIHVLITSMEIYSTLICHSLLIVNIVGYWVPSL